MSNKQSSTEILEDFLLQHCNPTVCNVEWSDFKLAIEQAKAMQKQQAEHYATFITNCVINNLPTITFNDWINSHNNEQ